MQHVIPETAGSLLQMLPKLIAGEPRVDETSVSQLVAIGAVYYAEKPPPRDLIGVRRELRPKRVTDENLFCEKGSYLRVHVHPKRGPETNSIDWRSRVLGQGTDWVVVDKPPGFSVNPTVDNAVECAAFQVARALIETPETENTSNETHKAQSWTNGSPLKVLHRLDVFTSGILMFARGNTGFAKHFHEALRTRRVHKTYRCVTCTKPKLGIMEHWTAPEELGAGVSGPRRHCMFPPAENQAPWSGNLQELEGTDGNGRKRCVLIVTRVESLCEETLVPAVRDAAPRDAKLYESRVELITGRTHQIRAQFAQVGAPLLGDVLYGGSSLASSINEDEGDCDSRSLESSKHDDEGDSRRLDEQKNGLQPVQPPRVLDDGDFLCLQSASMRVEVSFASEPLSGSETHETDGRTWHAGEPWWRR